MKAFKSEEGKQAILGYYDMLLCKLAVWKEEIRVDTRYGETHILVSGDTSKPPLILLHGSSMNSVMWSSDIEKLSTSHRIYAPDIPGEPGKSSEEQLPFDTDDYPNWLRDVMEALKLDSAALCGASLGAWLAAKFAILHPLKVTKLVLLCPAGIGSQNDAFKDTAMSLLMKGEEGVDELFTLINGGDPIPEVFLGYQKTIAAFFNSRQEPIPVFTDDELRRLTMPCAVFAGEKDIMLRSDETIERISKLIPHARTALLPGRGHSLTGLADEIAVFLE